MASRRSACRPPSRGCGACGGERLAHPLRVLASLALLLCAPLGVVTTGCEGPINSYESLECAVSAGGDYLVTEGFEFTGSLTLSSTLSLTGGCGDGDQPCVLDGRNKNAHFVVPRDFSLTLNNLVLANGGRGGGGNREPCLGLMAPAVGGQVGEGDDPLSLSLSLTAGGCIGPPKPYLDLAEVWASADTLCGRKQCGTVVVAADASLHVSRCSFVNNVAVSDGTYYARGSAISIVATAGFTIIDSSFVGNAVRSTYSSLAHGGGAISVMQPFNTMQFVSADGAFPPMVIQNTTFQNNFVYGLGGALYSQIGVGTLQVLNCTFVSNIAFGVGTSTTGLGGAVAVTFMKFNAPFQGADVDHNYGNIRFNTRNWAYLPDVAHADFSLHAHYTFSDTAFTNNTALPLLPTVPSPTSGGALYFGNGGYGATLTRCSLTANTASRGGAIYYRGQSVESVLVLEDMGLEVIPYNTHGVNFSFADYLLATGNILWTTDYSEYNQHSGKDDDYLALQHENADYHSLAPVAQVSGYMISLVDCSIGSNIATFLAPETAGRGGAVYVACGTVSASGTSFVSNVALAGTGFSAGLGSYGGAVYATNECSTPDLTSFVTTNVTLLNSVFRNNTAASEGGAVAVENSVPAALQSAASIVVSATGTTFDSNSADAASQGRGGALFGDSFAAFTLNSCTVVNNQAAQGGAVHASGAFAASQSSFSSNAASQQGGALYVAASASLTAVNFTANRAAVGGGLFVGGSSVASLDSCLLTSNVAVNGSGLAVAAGSNTSVSSSSSIQGHEASQFGTVFVSYPPTSLALAALFANNTAQAGGSVFYDTPNASSAAQPGSGDDQVVLNYGPKTASVPAAALFAVNGALVAGSTAANVALKSGAPLSLAFNLTDGFGQLVDVWRDASFDISCTVFAASPGAPPGGCPPAALRGVRHAVYFDGGTFVVAQVFGDVGASALLTATLMSPTVPLLLPPAGLSYTVNITVAPCASLEWFDARQQLCACAAGTFLNASLGGCSTCPLGSNAPQPGASYCNPNPPGFVSTTQTTLAANVTLAGVSAANFTASTRAALTASLAATLGVPAGAVNVTGVVDAVVPAGRRLLAASAVAAYAVTTTNGSVAASLRATLGNTAALGTSLTAALQSSGDPSLSLVTGAAPAPPTEVSVVLAAEACPAGTYLDSISQACQACQSPLVTTAAGATACEPCPTRSAWLSAAQCVACPSNSIVSPSDPTRCACQAGWYDTLYGANATAPDCAACPLGGKCDTGYVAAAAGWWREDTRSVLFYRCRVDVCVAENITGPLSAQQRPLPPAGQPSENCVEGNTGPLCAVCKDGFAMQSGVCAPCDPADAWDSWRQKSKAGLLVGCIIAGIFMLAIAFLQPVWPALERGVEAATEAAAKAVDRAADAGSACFRRCCCRGAPAVDEHAPTKTTEANAKDAALPQTVLLRHHAEPGAGAGAVERRAAAVWRVHCAAHDRLVPFRDSTTKGDAASSPLDASAPKASLTSEISRPLGHHHHTRRIDTEAVNHSLASNAAFALGNVAAFAAQVDGGAEEEDTGGGEPSGVERQTDFMDRLEEFFLQFKAAMKVFINFFQIASTFLKSLDVPWPSVFGAAMSRISLVNLNLVELPAAACLHPSPSYYSTFNGYTLGLLAAVGLSAVTWQLGKRVVAPLALRGVTEAERTERLARLNRTALARTLLVLYLVYPGVSVAIFAVFTCTTFESGNSYLDADARIMCYDSVHKRYMGGAAVWLVLVPFGIPAFFLWLLRRFKVPQMAALLSDNAWLREAIKLAWAEGMAQPADAATLTVDSITTLHLEALFAFFMHDMSAEDAAEIIAGTRPPVQDTAADAEGDPERASSKSFNAAAVARRVSGALRKVAGRVNSGVSRRIVLIKSVAAKVTGEDAAAARRELLLTSLLTFLRSSGDASVPPLIWERPPEEEVVALKQSCPDAVCTHSSGLRCADVPQVMETAMAEVAFLFAAYRMDCWYWEVVELIRKLMLTSILALIAPGSAGQVVVGILIAFVTLLAALVKAPYAQPRLNVIAQVAQLNLFFLLFVGLLLKLNVDGEADAGFFGGLVITVCTVPVVLPLVMRLYLRFVGGGLEARSLMRDSEW